MPGLPQQRNNNNNNIQLNGSVPANGIWSKHRDDVSFDQLQKFWGELSATNRQTLLRIDKQTLLEQARKNLYCSRCNGLLLEGFSQIVMYGKSLLQDGGSVAHIANGKMATLSNQSESGLNSKTIVCQNDTQDPSVHPWGGLIATREGILTLLDCFVEAESLDGLQNVFDSARVRERERELLYPDACGGGGRGWISQGAPNYGRGHGTRETCALHTARLSCDTLVDFWSALGDETRRSLLRMKEEDFIERLMYRFDSKRFCRDCRRNVIREFKELKELKRMRREPRCTSWFCVADTAFQYEVSDDMVLADWHQSFSDTFGTYHHFEWAVGTGEGKSDILEFEDVGMNGSVQVNGLDLGDLSSCFITLRAWKLDGRCTELSVKAHAMKGQACVHRRLVVGDGYVTITKGESIRRFFEHAEEAEEEEDDESMDKDGNEMDGEGSRPQKHAKSPELAREFLLDAATVIFKEQVEKAFREGTARQNAHCIFVCLALKLLEDRIHVACKEIITLEKQTKLLEEEEREKRHEEERKERRRTKEREKKLRRKERLKGKERQREEDSCSDLKENENDSLICEEEISKVQEESNISVSSEDSVSEICEHEVASPDTQEEEQHACNVSDSEASTKDGSGSFVMEQSKSSRRKLRYQTECNGGGSPLVDDYETRSHGPSKCVNGVSRQYRNNFVKSNPRSNNGSYNYRTRSDLQSYNCSNDYPTKDDNVRHYRNSKYYMQDGCGGVIKSKKVWEPKSVDIHHKSSTIEENTNPKENGGDDEKNTNPKDNGMSSSDNCSSCLSEGDSSTASSVIQNGESWSTSDSEDAGHHVEDDKDTKVNGVKSVPTATTAACVESSTCPTPVAVDVGPGLSPQQHRIVPPMYNLPMIPAPSTMAYYHQNPASWSAAPVNGLSPYAQPNRYLFTTPIGYGPSHLCMQYSPIQPVPIHPVYQSVNRPTTVVNPSQNASTNPEEHNTNAKVLPAQNGHGQQGQGLGQNQTTPQAATTKIRGGNTDFSLFHFGGPIAGCGAAEQGSVKEYNSFLNCDSNNKDATMEEYSLFAASNRTRFSFF